jgi:hypothetical protein
MKNFDDIKMHGTTIKKSVTLHCLKLHFTFITAIYHLPRDILQMSIQHRTLLHCVNLQQNQRNWCIYQAISFASTVYGRRWLLRNLSARY